MSGLISLKRAAELHFAETEAVAETVCGAGKFFQFGATFGVQQIELFVAVRETAETDTEQPDFSFHVAMRSKEFLKNREDVCVEARGLGKRFRARVCFKSGVTNRQREGSCGEAGFAEPLAGFL